MFIIALYIIPALWLGTLLGIWLRYGIASMLLTLPEATLSGMEDTAPLVMAAGILLNVAGNSIILWEMTSNTSFPKNIDAFMTYTGVIITALATLLLGWGSPVAITILSIMIVPNVAFGLYRFFSVFTETAISTLAILIALCVLLFGLTWITSPVML